MERIYVIEDDENIRNLLKVALEGFGYAAECFETAEEGLERIEELPPDLAIFDWMLPGMDGVSAIRKIRKKEELAHIPVILLTAKEREMDKVTGLDSGADDYMVKPFGVLELAARIRGLLRRSAKQDNDQVEIGKLVIKRAVREVYFDGHFVKLTLKEFELLWYLCMNRTRVVTREELLDHVWGYEYAGETRTLDMHVRTLRQKLGEEGASYVTTVRGVGYRLVEPREV
ncbi:MAG: response regulator transcription factor [Lachnospiraceae bacterium]